MEPDLVEPVQIDYSPLDIVLNGLNVYDQGYSKSRIRPDPRILHITVYNQLKKHKYLLKD
jgi:hypothetical protein